MNKRGLKNKRNGYEDELLARFKEVLPDDVKVTVLADRGFGDIKLYDFLDNDLDFKFVIRFRGGITVTDSKGETRQAQDWVGKNGRSRTLRNAKVTNKNYEVPMVVCVKAKKMKQTWCIVASDGTLSGGEVIRWYSKRWGCEPQFRDTKDIHFGMGLSQTSIGSTERRDRLLLISALSVLILTLLGAAGESLGMDRHMKANTVKRRTHSLFRQGCYYYNKMPTMKENDLKKLLEAFVDLLFENKSLQSILWVI